MRPRGFVLVTVAVLLVLIATAVFLVTRQAATSVDRASSAEDAAAARYAADAGLTHAVWLANHSNCTGYGLPSTPFGSGSYMAAFAPTSNSPVLIKADGASAFGGVASVIREVSVFNLADPQSFAFQFDTTTGKDALVDSFYAARNFGASTYLQVQNAPTWAQRPMLEFDLSSFAKTAKVLSAELTLFQLSAPTPGDVGVHRVTRSWSEGTKYGTGIADGATWQTHDGAASWSQLGGDFDATLYGIGSITAANNNEWVVWDIRDLVAGWVSGALPNFGLTLVADGILPNASFASRDAGTSTAPKLAVTYACECGAVCNTAATQNLLMVVVDPGALTSQEIAKRSLIESWGYTVNLIDEDDSQPNFDSAVATNDVVFITEDVTASRVDTKLAGAPIGVVTEEANLSDEFGLSSTIDWESGVDIEIHDNVHHITTPFALGPLTVFTTSESLAYLTGTLAAGLDLLGSSASAFGLVALEKGAVTHTGGIAPGRRVLLPWGGNDMDVSRLTANGLMIFERALEWGASPPTSVSPALWLSTLNDVTASGAPGLDTWTDGDVLSVNEPNFALEPGTSNGTFSAVMNLDAFAFDSDANIDAVHYVETAITVGSANGVSLQPGDVLFSTANDEKLTSLDTVDVADEDIVLFRPVTPGDYTSGNFTILLDGAQMHAYVDTVGISLVEHTTNVGDGLLNKGSFLFATTNRRDVQVFSTDDVGPGTTTGTVTEFIDGPSLGFGSEIRGMDVAETDVTVGGHTISAGSILLTLNNDDLDGVGDNDVPADSADIFYITVTQTGPTSIADATLLFEGLDVNLDTNNEHLQALSLTHSLSGVAATLPIAHWKLDETSGTTAVDSAGGHDATLKNGPVWSGGQIDGALDLDGTNDFADTPHADTLSLTTFSVTAWVRPTALSGWQIVVNKGTVGGLSNYFLSTSGDEVSFGYYNGAWIEFNTTTANLVADQWYHIAGTYDDATGEGNVYVDGVLLHTSTVGTSPVTNTTKLVIARNSAGSYWPGKLDDVRIYDSVLGAAAIADLAAGGGGGGGGGPACAATVADDFESNGYTGNTGTLNWNGNWTEVNEGDGPSMGDEQVVLRAGVDHVVRVQDNDSGSEGILRSADLSGYTSAELSFEYWRGGLDNANDYVAIEVWPNGTGGWDELMRIPGPASDTASGPPQTASLDISPYITNDTHIRFVTSPSMGNTDRVFFNAVDICLN